MRGAVDLQTVFTRFLPAYCQQRRLSPEQARVSYHVRQCRTAALGGLQWQCDQCAHQQPQYHSCRDRHCPKCQRQASAVWCERQRAQVLPVTYYHLVFTLPHQLNPWVALHPSLVYRLLFAQVWATLRTFGADPKRLGGTLGMSAVLHTWGQNLSRHVHLHCLVPGGALTAQGQWRAARSNYLFPVKALSRHFRGRMVGALRAAQRRGELHRVQRPGEVDATLAALMSTEWVVYTKAYLQQADSVVGYLARYSHRIALSDARLLALQGDQVQLAYKDYRDGRHKVLTLEATELIRRYFLHVLPKGFMRIRHFGFLANRCRARALAQIGQALAATRDAPARGEEAVPVAAATHACPRCTGGLLQPRYRLMPKWLKGG